MAAKMQIKGKGKGGKGREDCPAPSPQVANYRASKGFPSDVMRPRRATSVAEAEVAKLDGCLQELAACSFFTAELQVKIDQALECRFEVAQRVLGRLRLNKIKDRHIQFSNVRESIYHRGMQQMSSIRFCFLTDLSLDDAKASILALCEASIERDCANMVQFFQRKDWWRFDTPHLLRGQGQQQAQLVLHGQALELEIVEEQREASFTLAKLDLSWIAALHSAQLNHLMEFLRAGFGDMSVCDANGLTPLHLAALSGSAAIMSRLVDRALTTPSFQAAADKSGRTPLHFAALFDLPDLVREALRVCDVDAKDSDGLSAADVARDLGNHGSVRALTGVTPSLEALCAQRVRKLLSGDGKLGTAELGQVDFWHIASLVPLHEYRVLSRLSELQPGTVDGSRLQRSMSCLECWCAEIMNKGHGAALPGCTDLLSVWDQPKSSFETTEALLTDADGEVLAAVPGQRKPPSLADQRTFLDRLHRRTGGVLKNIDWSNVMMIGGMVLACLIADDDEYSRNFKETDVDLYVVGLKGQEFKDKVAEVISSLPASFLEGRGRDEEGKKRKSDEDAFRALPDSTIGSTVLRTPQTITAVLRRKNGGAVPNVQVVLAPYLNPAHLLFTTDIDCTAMGFDGKRLIATPRAREAIRRRRNLARPEKYMVRGEWRTEARLLKYARRGFRVVDLGLKPGTGVKKHDGVAEIARNAATLLEREAEVLSQAKVLGGRAIQGDLKLIRSEIEACIGEVQALSVHGAHLLLLAKREQGLRRLLTHEAPLIRAGLSRDALIQLVLENISRDSSQPYYYPDDSEDDAEPQSCNVITFNDGYGRSEAKLLIVNPSRIGERRVGDGRLRGKEMGLTYAIRELDLESDRFEVRSWYEGCPERQLSEHAELDPATWKGVGDFRAAA